MSNHLDHNALLLQVMAHDLLAPLTAIKWQIELLEKGYKDTEKRERYLRGLTESTELGISLSKHAHVAGKILSRSYGGDADQVRLSDIIQKAVMDLKLQYERHALVLKADIAEDAVEQKIDTALTKLYVWSVAKYFLAVVPPQTVVSMKGERVMEGNQNNVFVFTVHAENIDNAEACVSAVTSTEDTGEFDQKYVFSRLIREASAVLGVTVLATAHAETFTITSTFENNTLLK